MLESKKDESEDSDLDFGDDDDDDSDDDYEESGTFKPWQQKKTKSTVSRLDQMDESDEESTDDRRGPKEGGVPQVEAPAAELEDFAKVTIPRRRLARWCNEPFFMQAVKDSFVRLFLGEDDNGEKVYRLCQIIDVTKGDKTYKFPTANRRDIPVSTSLCFVCFANFKHFSHVSIPCCRFQPTSY